MWPTTTTEVTQMTDWQRGELICRLWIRDHQLGSIFNDSALDGYCDSLKAELSEESFHVSWLIELVKKLGYEAVYDLTEDAIDYTDLCQHCGDYCDHSCVCDRCFVALYTVKG